MLSQSTQFFVPVTTDTVTQISPVNTLTLTIYDSPANPVNPVSLTYPIDQTQPANTTDMTANEWINHLNNLSV